jgi:hypothetical protein
LLATFSAFLAPCFCQIEKVGKLKSQQPDAYLYIFGEFSIGLAKHDNQNNGKNEEKMLEVHLK